MGIDSVAELLCDLIALRTVNPMGRTHRGDTPVERPVTEYLERLFSPFNLRVERQQCSPIHESLLIEIPGRTSEPGTLIEAHMDTVPADDWPDRAFQPRREGTLVFGRGACDDKGSLVAMVVALLKILQSPEHPPQTVWFLAAGDEEYAQTGIKQFVAEHQHLIGRGIFGEPTDCAPVIQHKGTIRWDITVHGRSAHTSQPELGRNAILDAMRIIGCISQYQDQLCRRFTSPWMSGPTLTVTMISGGRTRNAVPDECTIAVDFRILPGMDRRRSVDDLFAALETLKIQMSHGEFQCFAPALNTSPDDPFVQAVLAICRETFGRDVMPAGVPYGSDACWVPDGVPAIVLGPGNIAKAHAVDECVDLAQVMQCAAIYRQLLLQDWSENRNDI
ncbi:MAG: M20/M25/M40 family metallo-hydrolase [Phycisphaerales bacterium]|nr:M20/M25/M40 family metallo-hydrolase [Phycisphaerales bacterium]